MQQVDEQVGEQDTVEVQAPAGPAGEVEAAAAEGKRLLIYAQGFDPDGNQVISLWNQGAAGGMVAGALERMRAVGWLAGGDQPVDGDQVVRRRHATVAAVLVAVAAFESAGVAAGVNPTVARLLLDMIVDGQELPGAAEWDTAAYGA